MIFLDTNILYHILHRTPRSQEALSLLEEHRDSYALHFYATLPGALPWCARRLCGEEMGEEARLPVHGS
ncbi:hypothetical protein [Pyrodictium abyssi]|uniref:PIN domain-containing protein n=1 Tax=Pyrodictium abyssi TaxID=54256 RepID=A0ABM8J043_9CREN|nr:hypothetical protein PABY_23420 [Pyrodictium abyssi]